METKQEMAFKDFVRREGKRAEKILSSLGKKKIFVDAFSSEVGQELLKDLMRMAEEKLDLIVDEEATEKDKAIFRVCKALAQRWAARINAYEVEKGKVFSG